MLTFNLKKEWFDKIKSGEKTHEYREVKYHWTTIFVKEFYKLKSREDHKAFLSVFLTMLRTGFAYKPLPGEIVKIRFMNGMRSEKDSPRMYAILKTVNIVDGKKTDLKFDGEVYDIEFELIKE